MKYGERVFCEEDRERGIEVSVERWKESRKEVSGYEEVEDIEWGCNENGEGWDLDSVV